MARPFENERKDIKALTLEKAKSLFLKFGYDKITIRKIATAVGCSPASIYLYFKNKDEILYELHNEGFRLLYEQKMEMAKNAPDDPLEKLMAGGLMYTTFALENPDYFELMFYSREPQNFMYKDKSQGKVFPGDYGMKSFDFLKDNILDCMKIGYFNNADPNIAAYTLWSTINGMISLLLKNRTPYSDKEDAEIINEVLNFWKNLIQSAK